MMTKKRSVGIVAVAMFVLFIALAVAEVFLSRHYEAERYFAVFMPMAARRFVAARVYQSAKMEPYAADRLIGYSKVVILDSDDFPDAWRQLCGLYVREGAWPAAKVACERVSHLDSSGAEYQSTLGNIYENLREYSLAENAYAAVAQMRPDEPLFKEQTLWMSLAARRYSDAVSIATALIEYGKVEPTKVDAKKAHIALGFAYAQLGNQKESSAAYAVGLADLLDPFCSVEQDTERRFSIVCSGVSQKSGRRVSSCMGTGCR